jgi:DNA modification methylase
MARKQNSRRNIYLPCTVDGLRAFFMGFENMIITGDSREVLKTLDSGSVNCCVTSPPYFGLRDYGHENQIGLEQTPNDYVQTLVDLFREVRRVLRDDGTLWLNLGDSYAAHKDCKSISQTLAVGTSRENAHVISKGQGRTRDSRMLKSEGFKNKDLIGIPWRVAFALQADGWYLRQDIIWHKPNPMPESVTDRCTKSHEYIFLLSKSERYYFDNEAIKEPATYAGDDRGARNDSRRGTECNSVSGKTGETRNKRSVWTVTTKPFSEAHFATFPEDLIIPCIKSGCPKGGVVLDPFNGAGTTGVVCKKLERDYLGIELNPDYVAISENRIKNTQSNNDIFTL